jgi:hypothetical protein
MSKKKLNYARHGKAIRRLPLNVALADRQHRNIPRLRRQAREPFKTPRPQVKGKFVMPAFAGIQVRFQFTIKNRLDSLNSQTKRNTFCIRCCDGTEV